MIIDGLVATGYWSLVIVSLCSLFHYKVVVTVTVNMKEFTYFLFVIFSLSSVALSLIPHIPNADDDLHIYALPVGQGDCTVIQCPKDSKGGKGLVTIIDAGASNKRGMGPEKVANFLHGTRLNLVVLTHSDKDHHTYIDFILGGYKMKVNVYHSCRWGSYNVKSRYAKHKKVDKCGSIKDCGVTLKLCPNAAVTLSVVASALGGCKRNKANNEDSIISKITYAGVSTLISGDFEGNKKFMEAFLAKGEADIRSNIYRLCHHGAYNGKANTKAFLNAVGAEYVFSSSGYMYKHPSCEVYNYYKNLLMDNVVPVHHYACYNQNGYLLYGYTSKAIYVTSAMKMDNKGKWVESFYVIQFDITSEGHIRAQAI